MSGWNVNPELEQRYSDDWPAMSRDAKRSRMDSNDRVQCSCCGDWHDWKQVETHHAYYLGDGDTIGINVFPVCGSTSDVGSCHHWLHLKEQWYTDRDDYVWGCGNCPEVVEKLRRGYSGQQSLLPYDFDWWVMLRSIGFVLAGLLFVTGLFRGQQPGTTAQTITINAGPQYSGANLRESPGGRKLGRSLSNGTTTTIEQRNGQWCKTPDGWIWCAFAK
jgi:hypothetical protein